MAKKNRKVFRRFIYWRPVRTTLHYSRKVVIPGFQGVPIYDVVAFFVRGLKKGFLNQRAAAMSFNFFLALFPLLLFFFTLIPYIPIDNIYEQLYTLIEEFVPNMASAAVINTMDGIFKQKHQGLMSIGAISSIIVASSGINSVINSFSQSRHEIKKRKWLRQRFISILFVIGIGLGVITSFLIIMGWQSILNFLNIEFVYAELLFWLVKWILLISVVYFMFAMLYYFGPANRENFKFFSAGASLGTILFIVSTFAFNYYIENFSRYNALYGSIGALIIFLVWIRLNSHIMLIGFELNASIAHAISDGQKVRNMRKNAECQ